jgi:hypothetical protein
MIAEHMHHWGPESAKLLYDSPQRSQLYVGILAVHDAVTEVDNDIWLCLIHFVNNRA